jgi:DNA (cytosine-5)-methyltransferase 1
VQWDGYFPSTLTDPFPTKRSGTVLHPEFDRVLSVREYARSQGFPDGYVFCGSVEDRYRQVGNAVPPPLAFQIGKEFVRVLAAKPAEVVDLTDD